MTDDRIKKSIQIAEELAKEICTGKPSTSALAGEWKEESPELYEKLRKQEQLPEEISFHDSVNVEESLQQVNKRIILPARRFNIRVISSIAASFLLIIGTATLWLWMENNREEVIPEWVSSIPVSPKTSIITHNEEAVELPANNLTVEGNRLIGSTPDGKRNVAIELKPTNQFNKLSVPAGGEYQLTLEDGTVVQVNAASELLFPTHFKKHIRQVELRGEAYFKVKSNPERPFYVLLGTLNVQVTGTTFNIKTYEEEDNICVTLIEGSVNVRKGQEILAALSPGEQFTYRKTTDEYSTTQANISAITGWTEDKFIFTNETIGSIMSELSRWYNVEISASEDIRDIRYSGILSRKQPLTEILNILHLTNELDFKFYQDRRIDAIERKD
ncbi:FecR domain-containing protein [uncultured Bacteroides sp.]|uniref:FecR family protein n=1 Tax=uncultured Bacteroides sp. TaxID=162156 RepID=UPI0025FBDAE3|nr:FecR domain-containing protein [uncultured Bacteroides sp.]